ncbi:hypothetical protein JOD54_001319 [Actinokineospora baliensis]|uniref:hypothetical protein n=1 Tax=Actinokineospora baliensis TaxID=547056 RepID=UPI0019592413|nr:hypothetical protein [Actinokineospora baliensis]MBM7771115.1 hypothetical protein [Actinokineospora baliensis]
MSTKSLPRKGFLAAIGLLALTACSADPAPVTARAPSSAAAPSTTTSHASAPAPEAAVPTTTSPAPKPAVKTPVRVAPVIGPTGYGTLTLGMTYQQALDTGRVLPPDELSDDAEPCLLLPIPGQVMGQRVGLRDGAGVVSIPGYGDAHTPEDIGPGSTRAQVKRTYPGFRQWPGGIAVAVPDHPNNQYTFGFNGDGLDDDPVSSIQLTVKELGCAG